VPFQLLHDQSINHTHLKAAHILLRAGASPQQTPAGHHMPIETTGVMISQQTWAAFLLHCKHHTLTDRYGIWQPQQQGASADYKTT
jgi:hypothetical protein